MQNYLEEFVRHFKFALSSREVFMWHQITPPDMLTDIQRAVRFFYLQQHAFGGKVDGQTWGTATTQPPINLLRIEENLPSAHLRLSGAFIENMDWHKLMERYDRPHTLFYLDPLIGRQKDMALILSWSSTSGWQRYYLRSRGRRSSA